MAFFFSFLYTMTDKEALMKTVGERIKEVRKALGLSGEAFGKPIGLSRGALSNIERNVNGASDRTIRLICSEYCVDYFWLTEGKGEMFIDDTEFTCSVKLRYRSVSTPCKVNIENEKAYITLEESAFGVATGQLAVFYDGQKVIGSAWIESAK